MNIQKSFQEIVGEADFITADGGFEWKDENYQEQEGLRLILGEIISALRMQKKGGNFVLKIFETFTSLTLKFIMILNNFYETVIIHKPHTSRPTNSERYLICTKFKGITKKELDHLDELLSYINTNELTHNYLSSLNNVDIPSEFELSIIVSNIIIMNNQFKSINKRICYLNNNNFFGDDYDAFYKAQIKAAEYWVNTYLPLDKDMLKETRKKLNLIVKDDLILGKEKYDKLKSSINNTKIIDDFKNYTKTHNIVPIRNILQPNKEDILKNIDINQIV
jgi:hypothetical protein